VAKAASSVRTVSGTRTTRTVTRTAIPSVPSEPTKTPSRSGPGSWREIVTSSPVGRTTSAASTWLTVNPYLRQCAPPEFSATLPPTEQTCWLDGSGAKYHPYGVAALVTSRLITPGSTIARSLATSTSNIRRIREVTISTPSACGNAPPDRPVPEPRATKGTRCAAQARTTAAICSADSGSTTRPGTTRYCASPSHS